MRTGPKISHAAITEMQMETAVSHRDHRGRRGSVTSPVFLRGKDRREHVFLEVSPQDFGEESPVTLRSLRTLRDKSRTVPRSLRGNCRDLRGLGVRQAEDQTMMKQWLSERLESELRERGNK
jgi:hypothetical protein